MAWDVPSDPVQFEEALEWFLARVPLTQPELEQLGQAARLHAFWIAGVTQLDTATTAWRLLADAQASGAHLADTKADLLELLEREWAGTVRRPSARVETIYRNAMQTSYNRGRFTQHRSPAVMRARPFWIYDALIDGDQTMICEARDGVVREATDPWWRENYPPLHHRCRSAVRTLTARQAEARGGVTPAPPVDPPPGEGWGRTPDDPTWPVEQSDYPPELWRWWERRREEQAAA